MQSDIDSQRALGHLGELSKLIRVQRDTINQQRIEIARLTAMINRAKANATPDEEPILSERILRVLEYRFGTTDNPINIIDKICALPAYEILRQPNFGLKSLKELERWLKFHGRQLASWDCNTQTEGEA
jgi:hypothetical protein